jgi:hypothetical protein
MMSKQNEMNDQIKIILTRESVCQADDVFAPNEKIIYFSSTKSVADLTNKILEIHYLANIFGGKATWIMKNEETRIAVVAQQWANAKFIIDEKHSINELKKTADCINIHFDYLTQKDPEIVYRNLILGDN